MMRKKLFVTFSTVTILLAWSLAFAGKYDGRWARPHVVKRYENTGLSRNIRVHAVRASRSGKSTQVAVETKASKQVRLFNVRRTTGNVYATQTGLLSQPQSRKIAHRKNRRADGSFSGVHAAGLSIQGASYRFNSKTSAAHTFVSLRTGKASLHK